MRLCRKPEPRKRGNRVHRLPVREGVLFIAEERMASEEVLKRLQVQIDGLSQRMRYDANDLDYETHLQRKRELQRILDTLKQKGKQEGFS